MTTQQPTTNEVASSASVAAVKAPPAPIETDNDDPSRSLNAFASAANFSTAQRIATALSQSTLVPKEYQRNLPNVLIAMEIAQRIGASIFMVMQHLDVIHGRPSWRATFLIATVNASQRFTPLRFRWEGTKGQDSYGCRAVATDRESGEECLGALISWALVKAENWSTKPGSKWMTMPEQMFMYRAAAFWTRVYSPELSLGMQTSEETTDAVELPPLQLAPVRTLEEKIAAAKNGKSAEKPEATADNGPTTPAQPAGGEADLEMLRKAAEQAKARAAEAAKPEPAQGGRATVDLTPADLVGNKTKPETSTRRRTAPAESCMVCKKPIVGQKIETTDNDGVVGHRHPACSPFGIDGDEFVPEDPDLGP